ncbi:MAG: GDSL-type esterase/lipase family protein [Pseudomonadota bacterium]|nr:GDSL-type esterase/lipase family protein [Pseudomonadota bacterium]
MTRKILPSILLTLAAIVVIGGGWVYATIRDMSGAEYWEKSIEAFETKDAESPPPKDAVLFVGSSSIVFWRSLAEDFAPIPVINRGFGGSQMNHLNYYRNRIVHKYKPRIIVVYEGDNDIAAGLTAGQVLEDYEDFITYVEDTLPNAKVCFIAIKPSVRREALWPTMLQVNQEIRDRAETRANLCFFDIGPPMLSETGGPRPDLFVSDGLHLNGKGYDIWAKTIRPRLSEMWIEAQ